MSDKFFEISLLFVLAGILYNVKPIRLKDRIYIDILSDSITSPLRLLLGWFVVFDKLWPPASLVLGFWMLSAYLMSIKRLAELRNWGKAENIEKYRRSFKYYTQTRLLICTLFLGLYSFVLLGYFAYQYCHQLVYALPFLCGVCVWYLIIGMKSFSAAQHPEQLLRERLFFIFSLLSFVLICYLIT